MLKLLITISIIFYTSLIYGNNINQITSSTDEKYTHNPELHNNIKTANPGAADYYNDSNKNPADGYGANADTNNQSINKKTNITTNTKH